MERELRNVAASVHARLLTLARDRGQELQRLLVHYALERFLYRLGPSEGDSRSRPPGYRREFGGVHPRRAH